MNVGMMHDFSYRGMVMRPDSHISDFVGRKGGPMDWYLKRVTKLEWESLPCWSMFEKSRTYVLQAKSFQEMLVASLRLERDGLKKFTVDKRKFTIRVPDWEVQDHVVRGETTGEEFGIL